MGLVGWIKGVAVQSDLHYVKATATGRGG